MITNNQFLKNSGMVEFNIAFAYKMLGQEQKSQQLFNELIKKLKVAKDRSFSIQTKAQIYTNLSLSLAFTDNNQEAMEAIDFIIANIDDHIVGSDLLQTKSLITALNGEHDEALSMLKSLMKRPNGVVKWELYLDPIWDFFRDDERFNELIKPKNFDKSIHAKNIKKDVVI
jgi:tetratricopeptide (TPR) repeat protein